MKGVLWKILLTVGLVALCLWAVIPPKDKIRLGKDLRGGVSLIYQVSIPENADADATLAQVIDVLKQRVNPQGVLDIGMQPQGQDRIEVVMPLPSEEVQELQRSYRESLDVLLEQASVRQIDVEAALDAGTAAQRFAGEDPTRLQNLTGLQASWDRARAARADLAAIALTDPVEVARETARLQDTIASAELDIERRMERLLTSRLSEQRVVDILNLSNAPRTGPDGGELPSEREEQLTALREEFGWVGGAIDELMTRYGAYEERRTGLDDPEDLKRLMRGAGVLEFRIAAKASTPLGVNVEDMRSQLAERGPRNTDSPVARWFPINSLDQWADTPEEMVALQTSPEAFLGQRDLIAAEKDGRIYILLYTTDAKSLTHEGGVEWSMQRAIKSSDQLGRPAVSFTLDSAGAQLMGNLTGPHVKEPMAIVLDGQVYSAPTLQSRIARDGQITGNFSDEQISYLIRVLAAGALEARLSPEPISTVVLGPSIGADNLYLGLEAVVLAMVITALIMIGYYFFAGFVADIALLINALLIFGLMALIDGTFTLPGLAGIALTIGMAVDANVLVYERIREELVNNKEDLRTAVRQGYRKAASAIVDGNVTNLIVCFVLYNTAATEVKGFALTLSLGVLGTLFTTLFVTRFIFQIYVEGFGARSLPMLPIIIPSIHRILEPKINWIGLRRILQGFALVLGIAGLIAFFSLGRDVLETEFRGGVSMTLETRDARSGEATADSGGLLVPRDEIEQTIQAFGASAPDGSARAQLRSADVLTVGQTVGADSQAASFQVKIANPPDIGAGESIQTEVTQAVAEALGDFISVDRPVRFRGSGEPGVPDSGDGHAAHTFALEKAVLGDNIGRSDVRRSISGYRGGVAVVLDGIKPAISIEDASRRIERMRNQSVFADCLGRDVEIVGLSSAGTVDTASGESVEVFDGLALLAFAPELDLFSVEFQTWDDQLAQREWELVRTALTEPVTLEQVSSFSPTVAENLVASAVVAVVLSLLGMLVYIWARFGNFWYSLAAVLALMFNVSVCLGALAVSIRLGSTALGSSLLLEEFRIDLNVIAGLLTIIGYSLNDTIVILDRIRENRGKLPYASAAVVNTSINQTFSRTVLTSGTTIVTALILYVLGGTGIRPFAFTFLVGLLAATFSSVAIAAPMVYRRGGSSTSTELATGLEDESAPVPA